MPFDIEAARKAGKTDDQIASYLGQSLGFDVNAAMKAGKTSTQIAEYLSTHERPASSPSPDAGNLDILGESTKAVKQLAPQALPMVGAVAGGVVGGIPGGILGYMGGKAAGRAIEGKPSDISTEVKDVLEGTAQELGGRVVAMGVAAGINKLKPYAQNLYESAMKPSTTLKESVRAKRVNTALEAGIPVSKSGLEQSRKTISQINQEISDKINIPTDPAKALVSRDKALAPLGDLSNKVQKTKIDPNADLVDIAKYVEEIQATQPEKIAIQQAQVYKQTLNKELNEYYAAFSRGKVTPPQIYAKTKAAMADGLRSEISDVFPELKTLNAKEGALIELNKSLERAVNRIRNREIVPLLAGIALGTSSSHAVLKALALKAVEHPGVKSRLAIALHRANIEQIKQFTQTAVKMGLTSFNINKESED